MADNSLDALKSTLLNGETHVASFDGRSQYSGGRSGSSACGLAALNCVRLVLQKERQGVRGWDLLQQMTDRSMFDDILGICGVWTDAEHLDVDEIFRTPIFSTTLALRWSDYDQPGLRQFQALLSRLQFEQSCSAALVITRPPEIISVVKISTEPGSVFVTFDSHPRQNHPKGAAFIVHPSLEAAAAYLTDLLKYDPALLADPTLQWQAQLLSHYSVHMFSAIEAPTSPDDIASALLDASFEILSLRSSVNKLSNRLKSIESDNKQLAQQTTHLEEKVEDLEEDVRQQVRRATSSKLENKTGVQAQASASVSDATLGETSRPKGKLIFHTIGIEDDDEMFATRIKLEWREEGKSSTSSTSQRQLQYEEEDRQLWAQVQVSRQHNPPSFECGICLEDNDRGEIASIIEGCKHEFCGTCALAYVRSKIIERRFPIPCPLCMAEKDVTEPGTINTMLVQTIGLAEEELSILTELELAAFSVPLHCSMCQRTAFVDREEYDAQDIIACPFPGCNNAWCKACSRVVLIGGPRHSCDGTSELNHLMNEQGWKHCPGCRTPTSKVEGCNHMTCISPACNTHFCYLCGEIIVQSVRRGELRRAISAHYSRCQLLDNHVQN